jgi:hypothetical protein
MPEKSWFLSVASVHKVTKELHIAQYKFVSDAVTVEEAFEAVHAAGFICVIKSIDGKIRSAGDLLVRISSGEI